jgi:hypothetical protein
MLSLAMPVGLSDLAAIPEMLTALVIFYLAYLITQVSDRFFQGVQSHKLQLSWLDADVVAPTRRIAKEPVWLFVVAMAYPYLPSSEAEAFKGLSVLIGLMLSLWASSLVGQGARCMPC